MTETIELSDRQRKILDTKIRRLERARQEAEKAQRDAREAVALVADSEDASYDPERGVVVVESAGDAK